MISVLGKDLNRAEEVLTQSALGLIELLHVNLNDKRLELLEDRKLRTSQIAEGVELDFLPETKSIRDDLSWKVAPLAPGLIDRRVEITGPTERKMTINALNSGAKVWLADQEDSTTPNWENVVLGQINLKDAISGDIEFVNESGKKYQLRSDVQLATIVMRPRGLHLPEKHILVDGKITSGSFVDFALYMANSAKMQIANGLGPYFYLAKLESYLEARLWNEAFVIAQDYLGIPRGSIRATVLIETYPAAFQMDEILYELREHCSGLNAGRWDYMFSIIKTHRSSGRDFVLPERNSVTMTVPFMRAYTQLLVKTCHKRQASAIGGMAAFIPSSDPAINEIAFTKVQADKSREAADGFDGSWVAHPGMVELCKAEFDKVLGDSANQINLVRSKVEISAADLLNVKATPGLVTEIGLRNNISVSIQYLESWLRGIGAVAIFNLMEDAATAEISRSQIWQWIHNEVILDDGRLISRDLVTQLIHEEVGKLGDTSRFNDAVASFIACSLHDEYLDFLTLSAYETMN